MVVVVVVVAMVMAMVMLMVVVVMAVVIVGRLLRAGIGVVRVAGRRTKVVFMIAVMPAWREVINGVLGGSSIRLVRCQTADV